MTHLSTTKNTVSYSLTSPKFADFAKSSESQIEPGSQSSSYVSEGYLCCEH